MITVNGLDEVKALAGRDLGHSSWLEVTQERVNAFAEATGDHQWIHVDLERARGGPFKGTIAHGYLTLSLVIPFFSEILTIEGIEMGVNYGLDKVRFPSPVRVGSKIRLAAAVAEVQEIKPGCVQMVLDFTVEIDGVDKPACVARPVYRYYA
ncbi:MaoC family dehydratase [Paractinoplanes brasiliensis]|uniref:Acyl dehydratase n=1 Tax=Paractinoplanes brasiliensis TaxID=52695 RepID=A0A4R6JAZ9_9ACTN|nr:MaoC family dehydratase [Actinoplanes brasiliensis]TDO31636.1 acyl dehydratase [Actinoplanes brasiliensis]GID30772.1 MaoC family dehydratase [Actinoplanes brasiliensis]